MNIYKGIIYSILMCLIYIIFMFVVGIELDIRFILGFGFLWFIRGALSKDEKD